MQCCLRYCALMSFTAGLQASIPSVAILPHRADSDLFDLLISIIEGAHGSWKLWIVLSSLFTHFFSLATHFL